VETPGAGEICPMQALKHTLLAVCGLLAVTAAPPAKADSVFKAEGAKSMFADRKAHVVGDIVTVVITETTQAEQDAETDISKSMSGTANGGSGLFGLLKAIPSATVGGSMSHTGKGSTTRNSSLTTTITCKVTGVTETGLLKLTGDRTLKVNADTQVIRFTGSVRTDDIAIDNTIASSFVADAKIEVLGKGPMDQHTRPGVLTNVFRFLF
jgi:flagellar L-ring protein precursor FlgH